MTRLSASSGQKKVFPKKKTWNAPSAGVIVVKRKRLKNHQKKSRASLLNVRRCQLSKLRRSPPAERSSAALRDFGDLLLVQQNVHGLVRQRINTKRVWMEQSECAVQLINREADHRRKKSILMNVPTRCRRQNNLHKETSDTTYRHEKQRDNVCTQRIDGNAQTEVVFLQKKKRIFLKKLKTKNSNLKSNKPITRNQCLFQFFFFSFSLLLKSLQSLKSFWKFQR